MAKTYKALMVEASTHLNVVVEAKKKSLTVDQFINQLLTK
jgi:hypothetical protein